MSSGALNSTHTNQVACCQLHRSDERCYWFGLYKITAVRHSWFYWFATGWIDGNTSPWRDYARFYPRVRYATCFYYTTGGWKDAYCDDEFYFTCKKVAGSCCVAVVL